MHTYIFNTDLGVFEITNTGASNHHHRMYALWLEDEKIGEYATAQDAADDVASFNTGYIEWDTLEYDGMRVPAAITGWTEVTSDECEDANDLERRTIAESPFLAEEEG